jgi:heme exporter protein D
MTNAPPKSTGGSAATFATQQRAGFRQGWPEWARQLPRMDFEKEPNPNYKLIKPEEMAQILAAADPESLKRLQEDIDFLDHELLRLFRQRDFEASLNQNRYRLFQIRFMLLAAIATVIGALQGLALGNNNALVPWLAFAETVVALVVTYQATISGRESPLPLWLQNRRRAEYLRREYFRYLMDLPPYDTVEGYERKLLLSTRAANINRGIYPDQQSE